MYKLKLHVHAFLYFLEATQSGCRCSEWLLGACLLPQAKRGHIQVFMIFWSLDMAWAYSHSPGKKQV